LTGYGQSIVPTKQDFSICENQDAKKKLLYCVESIALDEDAK